jgi:Alpha/beta hydrolase domain
MAEPGGGRADPERCRSAAAQARATVSQKEAFVLGRASRAPRQRRTLLILSATACAVGMLPGAAGAAAPSGSTGAGGISANGTETGNPGVRPGGNATVAATAPTRSPGAGPASITGPIPSTARPGDPSRNYIFYATPLNLRAVGYQEQEFFISGTATRFNSNPTTDQQRVPATPIGTMPYTTRIVVRSPVSPARSAGIAVVDWQNVTAGHDIDTEWGANADYYVRHGWTYIGASVQRVGVNGATTGATAGLGLTEWNPSRYGSLDVTAGGSILDDSQSFDIYTQVAELAKGRSRDNPLSGLRIREVLSGGASQSARFQGIYYNTVQPLQHVYDGFLIAIGGSSLPPQQSVGTKVIRVDTENDLVRGIGTLRVPDNPALRTWEIAGASHVPAYATGTDVTDFRTTLGAIQAREFGPTPPVDCQNPGPSTVASWAIFHAAYDALDKWVRTGLAPRMAEPVALVNPAQPTFPRDSLGLALGGIRLPDVEVPIGLNDGINGPASLANPLSAFCILYGTHRDFAASQLAALYTSNADYHRQVIDVVRRLEGQRFVLPEDGVTLISQALHTRVR